MPIIAEENLEEKYWIKKEGTHFEFFPSQGKIVCETDVQLLKAIHFVGKCNLEVDWTSFKGRTFLINYAKEHDYKDYLFALNKLVAEMESQGKLDKKNLLANNINNATGKSLSIHQIRVEIRYLLECIKSKKKNRQHVIDYFNRYNIEDDVERQRTGASIMEITTKSSKVLIQEGKGALERLFKKGKLVKLTREEFDAKMELYNGKQ